MVWLKKYSPYFKVTEIIHRKFENLVIFFIQATVNNYYYDILPSIFQNNRGFFIVHCLYTCSICIWIQLCLDYDKISNKHHTLKCGLIKGGLLFDGGAYSSINVHGVAFIRGRRLFETQHLLEETW